MDRLMKRKLKGATLVESLMALTIILITMSFFFMTFIFITKNNPSYDSQALFLIKSQHQKTLVNNSYINETSFDTLGFNIENKILEFESGFFKIVYEAKFNNRLILNYGFIEREVPAK